MVVLIRVEKASLLAAEFMRNLIPIIQSFSLECQFCDLNACCAASYPQLFIPLLVFCGLIGHL